MYLDRNLSSLLAATLFTVSAVARAQGTPPYPSGTLTPATGSPFAAGSGSYSLAVGDFNGDGKPDLAVANTSSSNVTILLGNGSGGFSPAPSSPIAVAGATTVAVADFNGDGKQDLAVAGGGVTILLGDGAGGFKPAPGSPVAGANAFFVAVGDFNGDRKPDLAVTNYSTDSVNVFLGDGLGGFSSAAGSPFGLAGGSDPRSIAVADFNGDGKLDLAVTNEVGKSTPVGQVDIFLGNGAGGFTLSPNSPYGAGSNLSIAVGDFNGDGKPDLAAPNVLFNSVDILLGDGTGKFTYAPRTPQVGRTPEFIAVGDLNGDGNADLAVTNMNSNDLSVLLGNGLGGFSTASGPAFAAGTEPTSVAVADFNGDGRLDLASVSYSGNVTVLLGGIATPNAVLTTTAGASVTAGQPVALTLTVSSVGTAFNAPTGTATFYDGSIVLGKASQNTSPYTFSTTGLGVGSHSLTAIYGGDARTSGVVSNGLTIQVTQGSSPSTAPVITAIDPSSADYTRLFSVPLTVYGTGFAPGAVVQWNGTPVSTTYFTPNQLTAVVSGNLPIGPLEIYTVTVNLNGAVSNGVTFTFFENKSMLPIITVTNDASFATTISPGSLVALYGNGDVLATTTASGFGLPLPTSSNGTSVTIGGIACPLIYVSPNQINLQAPMELPPGTATAIVNNNGHTFSTSVLVMPAAPGIFTTDYYANGGVAVLQDSRTLTTLNAANPAAAGQNVTMYFTGIGQVTNNPGTGNAAPGSTGLAVSTSTVSVTVNGVAVQPSFVGLTPGFAGLGQVNFQLPANTPSGNAVPMILIINGTASKPVQISVR